MNYRVLRINSQPDFSAGVMFTVDKIHRDYGPGSYVEENKVKHLCYT
ncbi:hypothetical protein LCGC14_2209860, partial [marine sediment metagenome]